MSSSEAQTAVQRIVLSAFTLKSFTPKELADHARTKPATTRVVLKRLVARWPQAFTKNPSRSKLKPDAGFNTYVVNSIVEFDEILKEYNFSASDALSDAASEHLVSETNELARSRFSQASHKDTNPEHVQELLDQSIDLLESSLRVLGSLDADKEMFEEAKSLYEKVHNRKKSLVLTPTKEPSKDTPARRRRPLTSLTTRRSVEEKIGRFCELFLSFDFSKFAFENVIHPTVCHVLENQSRQSVLGAFIDDDISNSQLWRMQLEHNALFEIDLTKRILHRLMDQDNLDLVASIYRGNIDDRNEFEALNTARRIVDASYSRYPLSAVGLESGSKVPALKIQDHIFYVPYSPIYEDWAYLRKQKLHGYLHDIRDDWSSGIHKYLDDPSHNSLKFQHMFRSKYLPFVGASSALEALIRAPSFDESALVRSIRTSMLDALKKDLFHGQETSLDTTEKGKVWGHYACILKDPSISDHAAASLRQTLEEQGLKTVFGTFLDNKEMETELVAHANEFSPTLNVVALDEDNISEETRALLEATGSGSYIVANYGTGEGRTLPIDPRKSVSIRASSGFRVNDLVDASIAASHSSSDEDFGIYRLISV